MKEMIKNKAAKILNCFGYENLKAEHLNLIEYSSTQGIYDYILVSFEDKIVQLNYNSDGESRTWKLLYRN